MITEKSDTRPLCGEHIIASNRRYGTGVPFTVLVHMFIYDGDRTYDHIQHSGISTKAN